MTTKKNGGRLQEKSYGIFGRNELSEKITKKKMLQQLPFWILSEIRREFLINTDYFEEIA